jgi:hypothetical protein
VWGRRKLCGLPLRPAQPGGPYFLYWNGLPDFVFGVGVIRTGCSWCTGVILTECVSCTGMFFLSLDLVLECYSYCLYIFALGTNPYRLNIWYWNILPDFVFGIRVVRTGMSLLTEYFVPKKYSYRPTILNRNIRTG